MSSGMAFGGRPEQSGMVPNFDVSRLNTGQQKIPGYRDLTDAELEAIKGAKQLANEVGKMIAQLGGTLPDTQAGERARWLAVAKTDLQKGFMALKRAIALPGGF